MSDCSENRVVLFDVGGVLVNSHPDPEYIASLIGDGRQSLVALVDQAMWAHRDAYDAGCTDREFWDRVAGDCGKPAVSEELLAKLVEHDAMRVHEAAESAIDLVAELHAKGVRLGILSNAPFPVAAEIRRTEWARYFETFTFSCDEGANKPHRAIYRAALDATGVEPENAIFFDDRKKNIRAAELLGIEALMWTNAECARREPAIRDLLS